MPTSLPSSTTGRWPIRCSSIRFSTSDPRLSGDSTIGSFAITALTGVAGSIPCGQNLVHEIPRGDDADQPVALDHGQARDMRVPHLPGRRR